MKTLQNLKGEDNTKLVRTAIVIVLCILLTSGAFAIDSVASSVSASVSTFPKAFQKNHIVKSASVSQSTSIEFASDNTNTILATLTPTNQKALENKASYTIEVSAPSALVSSECEIRFHSDALSAVFDEYDCILQPDKKLLIPFEVSAHGPGDHKFTIELVDKEHKNSVFAEGLLSVPDILGASQIKLDLTPGKQYASSSASTFYVILAPTASCDESECPELYAGQRYDLFFSPQQEFLFGEFSESSVFLKPGEKKTLSLKVTAEKEGTYQFKVYAKASDTETSVRGLLVYGKDTLFIASDSYFDGEGFAISEASSSGSLISLNVLKNKEELRGKSLFAGESFAVKGALSDENITLQFYDLEAGFKSVGEFTGNLKTFEEFSLILGHLEMKINSLSGIWNVALIQKIPTQSIPQAQNVQEEISPKKKLFGLIFNPWSN